MPPTKEPSHLPEYKQFAYDSIKTKVKSTSAQGPPDGSTWLWFIVAQASVQKRGPNSGGAGSAGSQQLAGSSSAYQVHITGKKFQVGWFNGGLSWTDKRLSTQEIKLR